MSGKSAKPAKTLKVPRALDEIQKEYQQLCLQTGQLQYQKAIYEKEITSANIRLEAVNNEAAARKQLDAQETAKIADQQTQPGAV